MLSSPSQQMKNRYPKTSQRRILVFEPNDSFYQVLRELLSNKIHSPEFIALCKLD